MRAIERAGFTPGSQVAIALDIAASEFGRGGQYKLALEDKELDSDGMIKLLTGWIRRYPIVSIEDPLAEDDDVGFAAFTHEVGERVQIVGDDFLVTQASRVREAALRGAANAVLLKPNQRGTLTETFEAWQAAQETGFAGIVSARSGETEDVTIVHLAVGWGVGQLKVGSFARSERMAKWNEALRIEEALGARARFAGGGVLGRSRAGERRCSTTPPARTSRRASPPFLALRVTVCPEDDDALLAAPAAGNRRAVARAEALHGRDDRRRAAAAADPEDRRRREHHRPRRGEGARHRRVQPARHQRARGGRADAGADAGGAAPPAALRRGDARAACGPIPALQDGIGELGGRTVGLVGYGAIPRLLAPVLAALGCRAALHRAYAARRTPSANGARWMRCWPKPISSACICR